MIEDIIEMDAGLIFDSWLDSWPELRADSSEDRHLIYEGDGIILDLLLKRVEKAACLQIGGQILPGDATLDAVSDVRVCMEQGKQRLYTQTNALGEFTFDAVPNESFNLTIALKNRKFRVSGLANREPRMWRVVPSAAAGGD